MKRCKRSKKKINNKNKTKKIILISLLLLLFITLSLLLIPSNKFLKEKVKLETMYLGSATDTIELYSLETTSSDKEKEEKAVLIKKEDLPRGKQVKSNQEIIEYQEQKYQQILLSKKEYYVKKENLVSKEDQVVQEKIIYTRNATSILENEKEIRINGFAKKGDELKVIGYDKLLDDGHVHLYKIDQAGTIGYVYGKYMSYSKEEALKNYNAEIYDPIHSKISNAYGGGEAMKLDFYPNEVPAFENNKMPDSVYALYLNCGSNTIKNIDAYIEFAKTTQINAFVIDIKDNESPAYPADTFKNLSPTNYEHAINTTEEYSQAIDKLKKAGFYVIGRITTFKDSFYVKDHPEDAIIDKNTAQPYLHNGSYWPSAYNRNVWYYTLSLAKESIEKFGFNEINFDYVRFPDRMNSISNKIELKNTYNEDKVEAIQRFIQYAKDVLHESEVYISVDVFGETTNGSYTTAYGQYWPAISNVADVISGMPYPDHFSAGSYGLKKPWNEPYQLMKYWGTYAMDRQKEIPTPASVRTWIQAYDVMKYVDSNGINYGAKEVEAEIRGLYDAGLRGGYITWLSSSNLEKYKTQAKAFQIDYWKEYNHE